MSRSDIELSANPYAVSAKARYNIIGMCRNGSALRIYIDNYRSHEVLIAYNEKLIAICRSKDIRYLIQFVQENKHQLFLGYRGRAAISALDGRFVCAHRYLLGELDVSEDVQIEKIIMLNHSDSFIRFSTKFDPRLHVQTATEKEFAKIVSCVCAIGDRYLIGRLLEYRMGRDRSNVGIQPLHINTLVVGLAATSYLRNPALFNIFLRPFITKVRDNSDLRHYARYVLRHAAEGGDRQTWLLALEHVEFSWLGYAHTNVSELEDYECIPQHILPYLIEICAESTTKGMLSMFIDYIQPHIYMFGSEYMECIVKLASTSEHIDVAHYLILGYAMTDADAELLWDAFAGHPLRDSLIESVMIANANYNTHLDSTTDLEHIVPASPTMPVAWPF